MKKIDFIPKDLKLCSNCLFYEQCPYEWTCKTWKRVQKHEWTQDDINVCYGNSTEKIR